LTGNGPPGSYPSPTNREKGNYRVADHPDGIRI
jgi:hypothetical protein